MKEKQKQILSEIMQEDYNKARILNNSEIKYYLEL